jgi:xylulokinase
MSDHGDALFLGIDVGTGSSKAVLADAAGTVVDSARIAHDISLPRPDWAEFDAEGVGWPEVQRLSAELLARHDRSRVAGVCVSAMGPCLVVTDDQLHPLRPTILYGIDARAGDEIRELTELIGSDALLAEGGKLLSSQAVGPKLRWISRHEQDVWRRASQWHSLSSYLVAKLTGEHVLDHHTASQCDPMYDLAGNRWHPERLGLLAEHLATPRLAWPAEVVGQVHAAAAESTGIPKGVPVCAGTVDAWSEALGAGVRRPGDLLLMYGSTMFFVKVIDRFAVHDKLWTTAGVEPGTLTLAAGMSTSGSLLDWMQRLFGGVPFETLLDEAAATPPGADGLLVLPYFAGERTPVFDPDARGLIIGLTLRHGRGNLYRAACEGIGFGIRQIVDLLDGIGQPIERIRAVGGGAQARLWLQIVSDISGRPQEVPAQTIGASYGDALLAATGTGAVPEGTDWAVPADVIAPDPDRKRIYDRLFATYETLYPATAQHVHELARMQAVAE